MGEWGKKRVERRKKGGERRGKGGRDERSHGA